MILVSSRATVIVKPWDIEPKEIKELPDDWEENPAFERLFAQKFLWFVDGTGNIIDEPLETAPIEEPEEEALPVEPGVEPVAESEVEPEVELEAEPEAESEAPDAPEAELEVEPEVESEAEPVDVAKEPDAPNTSHEKLADDYLQRNAKTVIKNLKEDGLDAAFLQALFDTERVKDKPRKSVLELLDKLLA